MISNEPLEEQSQGVSNDQQNPEKNDNQHQPQISLNKNQTSEEEILKNPMNQSVYSIPPQNPYVIGQTPILTNQNKNLPEVKLEKHFIQSPVFPTIHIPHEIQQNYLFQQNSFQVNPIGSNPPNPFLPQGLYAHQIPSSLPKTQPQRNPFPIQLNYANKVQNPLLNAQKASLQPTSYNMLVPPPVSSPPLNSTPNTLSLIAIPPKKEKKPREAKRQYIRKPRKAKQIEELGPNGKPKKHFKNISDDHQTASEELLLNDSLYADEAHSMEEHILPKTRQRRRTRWHHHSMQSMGSDLGDGKLHFNPIVVYRRAAQGLLKGVEDPEKESPFVLSELKSARDYVFQSDHLTATLKGGYRLCRSTHGFKQPGKYYWEFSYSIEQAEKQKLEEIEEKYRPHVRVGISTLKAHINYPCGVDESGYSIRNSGGKFHDSKKTECDWTFAEGDIVGLGFEITPDSGGLLHMFINHEYCGVLFDKIDTTKRWFPSFSIYKSASIHVNFSPEDTPDEFTRASDAPNDTPKREITTNELIEIMESYRIGVREFPQYQELILLTLTPTEDMPY